MQSICLFYVIIEAQEIKGFYKITEILFQKQNAYSSFNVINLPDSKQDLVCCRLASRSVYQVLHFDIQS